jgi:hypothetical protein
MHTLWLVLMFIYWENILAMNRIIETLLDDNKETGLEMNSEN